MSTNSVLRGSRAIAKALGVSPATVKRLAKSGKLPCFKIGDNTSPLTIRRTDLARITAGQRDDDDG